LRGCRIVILFENAFYENDRLTYIELQPKEWLCDSIESWLLASSLIPAVVQEVLDEAVIVAVSFSDDFLLRLRQDE